MFCFKLLRLCRAGNMWVGLGGIAIGTAMQTRVINSNIHTFYATARLTLVFVFTFVGCYAKNVGHKVIINAFAVKNA